MRSYHPDIVVDLDGNIVMKKVVNFVATIDSIIVNTSVVNILQVAFLFPTHVETNVEQVLTHF